MTELTFFHYHISKIEVCIVLLNDSLVKASDDIHMTPMKIV